MGMSEAAGDHITLISNWTPKRTICPNTSSLIIALSKGRTLLGDCDFPFVLLQELGGVLCASIRLNRGHSPHHAFRRLRLVFRAGLIQNTSRSKFVMLTELKHAHNYSEFLHFGGGFEVSF